MNEMVPVQNQAMMAMPSTDVLAFCSQLPERDLVAVQASIKEIACSSPEMAMACIYCSPVGKDKLTGRQKFAQNESVRLAEIAQSKFKNMWVKSSTVRMDDSSVTADAMAFDMQTLNAVNATCTRPCYGRPQLAEAAAHSIAKRNAILGHVRPYTQTIMDEIKQSIVAYLCVGGDPSIAIAWKNLVAKFVSKYPTVTEEDLREVVSDEDSPVDKIVLLVGIKNALDDRNVTLENVFAKDMSKPAFTKTKVKEPEKTVPASKKKPDAPVGPEPKTVPVEAETTSEKKPVSEKATDDTLAKQAAEAAPAKELSMSQKAVVDAAKSAGVPIESLDKVLEENFELNLSMVRLSHIEMLAKFFKGYAEVK